MSLHILDRIRQGREIAAEIDGRHWKRPEGQRGLLSAGMESLCDEGDLSHPALFFLHMHRKPIALDAGTLFPSARFLI